ncbi:MAG: hypothetical protein HOP11_08205 [Saprospiraceae bacterium]|nr:hypothetical protein [Saprospiraceae bacterium]
MDEILKSFGFTSLGANKWSHQLYGVIQVIDDDTVHDILHKIYMIGWNRCKEIALELI